MSAVPVGLVVAVVAVVVAVVEEVEVVVVVAVDVLLVVGLVLVASIWPFFVFSCLKSLLVQTCLIDPTLQPPDKDPSEVVHVESKAGSGQSLLGGIDM